MQALATSLRQVSAGGQEATSWIENLGNSFAAHVAEGMLLRDVIREIITVGEEAFTKAARFDDLAKATGLSIDEVQRFSYVGKEFGVDAEQMARGVEQLSAKLAGGDQNAVKAVQMLGLNVKDLIAAGPREAFLQIAEATGRVSDPMMKNALATDEFGGKLAKILIPALAELRQKMNDIPKGAILSNDNVVNAHDLEVSWGHLKDVWGNVFVDLIVRTSEAFGGQAVKVKEATAALDEHRGKDIEIISTAQLLQNRLAALRGEAIEPLTAAQKENILELQKYGVSHKEIAELVKASEIAVRGYITANKDAEEASKKAAETAIAYDKVWSDFHVKTLELAGEHEKKWHDDALKLLAEKNKAVVDGFEQIRSAQQRLSDFEDQQTMDATDYQVKKIWERAAEEIRSFKGTEQERASFNSAILQLASEQADALYEKDAEFADKTIGKLKEVAKAAADAFSPGSSHPGGLLPSSASLTAAGFIASMGSTSGIVPRAGGGPVDAGQTYIVGERGPETLVMGSGSGAIVPNGASMGGSAPVFNIYVTQPLGTPQQIAAVVGPALISTLRGQGMRIVSGA
jgi:hypothetical protein